MISKQELDLKLVTQGMLSSRNNIKLTFIFKNEAIYQHGVSIIGIREDFKKKISKMSDIGHLFFLPPYPMERVT